METAKVSLHVFVRHEGKIYAVCQVRGDSNFEDLSRFNRAESWARGLKPLAAGKMKPGETPNQALLRESEEELGGAFHDETKLWELEETEALLIGPSAHWGVEIEPAHFRFIMLHPSTGGLRLICKDDFGQIVDLKEFDKAEEIPERCNAMFSDEREAMIALCP